MKKNDNQIENIFKSLGNDFSNTKLSKRQKQRMLNNILGTKQRFRLLPYLAMGMSAILLTASIFVVNAKPGDITYSIKRTVEDVRTKLDPNYNEVILQNRKNELEDLQKNRSTTDDDTHENKIDIVEQEIEEIETRINSPGIQSQISSPEQTEIESTEDDSSRNRGSTTNQANTPSSSTYTSEQECKNDLDARKKSGENISSDAYKQCDAYKN